MRRVKIMVAGLIYLVLSFSTTYHISTAEDIILSDSSGRGNKGIVYGNATFIPGKFGSAIHFNHMDNYVKIVNSENLNLPRFSIEAWFKLDSLPSLMPDGGAKETYYMVMKSSQYYLEIATKK